MREGWVMRVGNQTSVAATTCLEPFDYALAHGFDAFEWFPDKKASGEGWDADDLSLAQRQDIRDTARSRNVRLSVHARLPADPWQPDARKQLSEDVALAEALGADLLNIHLVPDQGMEAYAEGVAWLVDELADKTLQLAIENTPPATPQHFNEFFERMRARHGARIGHVGMCLDLGHANLCPTTRNDYLRYIDELGPHVPIIHVHLHENWGDADRHLPLFTGPSANNPDGIAGLVERLKRRGYSGSLILEQWPQPPALLDQACARLRTMFGVVSPVARPSPISPSATVASLVAQGESRVAAALIAGERDCRSWREKLDFICQLLGGFKDDPTTLELVDLAVYLRFLAAGEIACAEDGRHFRPSHHSRLAVAIREKLTRLSRPEHVLVVRQILAYLPSTKATFRSAEPLTRIRDIAHRNDIPRELKLEIKHTLQNKLHRCAGPEDLVTSAAILRRLTTAGADYSPEFVAQFYQFHEELKEFFNACSLEEQLSSLAPECDAEVGSLIEHFLSTKRRQPADWSTQLRALRLLTQLRRRFVHPAAPRTASGEDEARQADVALEQYAFVLLSEMANAIETQPPAESWDDFWEVLSLTLENLALSGIAPEEAQTIQCELETWRPSFRPGELEPGLRFLATLERAQGLIEDHCNLVLSAFTQRAAFLGRALGVAESAILVFSEAELRRHLVFQFSKWVTAIAKFLREQLKFPPWDIISAGEIQGRLLVVEQLDAVRDAGDEQLIAVLRELEGDEALPAGVVGILVERPLPHLSHLAVRARQAGVVIVSADDPKAYRECEALSGQWVKLCARAEGVSIKPATKPPPTKVPAASGPAVTVAPVRLEADQPLMELGDIEPETGGAKAAGVKKLADLARLPGADFSAPSSWVVPFGVMARALHLQPELARDYQATLAWLGCPDATESELLQAGDEMRRLIGLLRLPDSLMQLLKTKLGIDSKLMVRSSSNCEDLSAFSGAGLHDSVANVTPSQVPEAIRTVWSSLWNHRAVLARRQAGIPPEQAQMAVLIQSLISPDYSFILHTVNPITGNDREAYLELAVGLGETLASASVRGNPYRLIGNKTTGQVQTLHLASISRAWWPSPDGGLKAQPLNYTQVELTCNPKRRLALARRLIALGTLLEAKFGQPQDIEGTTRDDAVFLVQSRPQMAIAKMSRT